MDAKTFARCLSWICGLIFLVTASSPTPSITHCELMEHANITCYWTAVSSEASSYMLWVNMTYCWHNGDYKTVGTCSTLDTWCSVTIGSVAHCFCVGVLASSPAASAKSPRHCFAGINEGKPRCLRLEWTEDMSTHLPSERAHRVVQIEYTTHHQARPWKVSTVLHNWKMELCGLYPGTEYVVRLRAQDTRALRHWSGWSEVRQASTAESAPGAAPVLWRRVETTDKSGQRRLTLLWKALRWPDANGVILSYAASCWSDLHRSRWDCGHLDSALTSCVVSVSAHPCVCDLTASNAAGTSPAAQIHIPGERDTALPPPVSISATALDDFQLKVEWTATVNQSDTSFVLEWLPIMESTFDGVYWEKLNGSARSYIITEGLFPEVPYNVSVQVLHEKETGAAIFGTFFTREGAPSVGPKLKVPRITTSSVTLKWDPVPLEKLHGFIQNYTVLYVTNSKMKSQPLGGDVEQFLLTGLTPGEYAICVKAHTVAGSAEGQWVTVAVGSDYILIVAILCTVGGLLILVIILSQGERIQQRFWPTIPNPSRSSLSSWTPGCPSQHKVTALEFMLPPSVFDLINLGRVPGHRDHPRDELHQSRPSRRRSAPPPPLVMLPGPPPAKTAERESDLPARAPIAEDPAEEPITDLGYRNLVAAKPLTLRGPSGCPPTPDCRLGKETVDSLIDERNLMPTLRPWGQSPVVPEVWTIDKVNSSNLLSKKNVTSRSESGCDPNMVYTRYLPALELQLNFRKETKDFTNLIHKSNLLSPLESCCMHMSTSYLPGPQSPLDYSSLLMETSHSTECSPWSKTESSFHINLSNIRLPVSVTHANLAMETADSFNCAHQHGCRSSLICKELEVDNTYRALSPEERDLRFS
ncbi:interleukin-6 receptor subunit beta isoform X2 [Brachyhypopomus gauderio]|uniref:interleukin-6 receptor subunit beta isoform X2 n=1 Tax=Brachyhypopomus gauderio TaxID=698409 RepID=UPI0040432F22